jgi:hypothetical protein
VLRVDDTNMEYSWNDMRWRKTEVLGEKLCQFAYDKYYVDVTEHDTPSLRSIVEKYTPFFEAAFI